MAEKALAGLINDMKPPPWPPASPYSKAVRGRQNGRHFVPLTGFRRRGKLYGTRAKAVEYAVSRK